MHYPKHLATTVFLSAALSLSGCGEQDPQSTDSQAATGDDMETSVAEYIKQFPYQDTYNYAMQYTGGDAAKFNVWTLGADPALIKAGEDKVVRMNNDTYYKMAFFLLDQGPVVLDSTVPGKDRFVSFQYIDDHNVNFRNVINPNGAYTLYYGDKPGSIVGEAIESPSALALVIVRVEVKDKNDAQDVKDAQQQFTGITLNGPAITTVPKLDLLSGYDEAVATEALKRMDQVSESTPFSQLVPGPGDVPGKVSYLQLAAGTKVGWGGPAISHSAYEFFYVDDQGNDLKGSTGSYILTTDEPPVDAFWSITVYDTDRGGFFHPNKADRYHINNSGATKNADGTITFTFKQQCQASDLNCLEVPAGRFDYVARYYLPAESIQSGDWVMPKATLQ